MRCESGLALIFEMMIVLAVPEVITDVTGNQPMNATEIENLLDDTTSANPKTRRAALLQLCPCHIRNNVARIWDRIIEMRTDENPGVRSIVLHNLCDGSPRERESEVVAAVELLAYDSDHKIRRRARRALAAYRRTGQINVE